MEKFDNRKLRGKITEKFGTLSKFAKAMEMSRQLLHLRLKTGSWRQVEIIKALEILEINNAVEAAQLFFTRIKNEKEAD